VVRLPDDQGGEVRADWAHVRQAKTMIGAATLTAEDINELLLMGTEDPVDDGATEIAQDDEDFGRVTTRSNSAAASPPPSSNLRQRTSSASTNGLLSASSSRAQLLGGRANRSTSALLLRDFTFIITAAPGSNHGGGKAKDGLPSDWRNKLPTGLRNAGAIVVDEWAHILSVNCLPSPSRWRATGGDLDIREPPTPTEKNEKDRWKALQDDFTALKAVDRKIVLLADQPCGTPKYLLALALGVPCVSAQWAMDVIAGVCIIVQMPLHGRPGIHHILIPMLPSSRPSNPNAGLHTSSALATLRVCVHRFHKSSFPAHRSVCVRYSSHTTFHIRRKTPNRARLRTFPIEGDLLLKRPSCVLVQVLSQQLKTAEARSGTSTRQSVNQAILIITSTDYFLPHSLVIHSSEMFCTDLASDGCGRGRSLLVLRFCSGQVFRYYHQ
jgi:hypothetical protein